MVFKTRTDRHFYRYLIAGEFLYFFEILHQFSPIIQKMRPDYEWESPDSKSFILIDPKTDKVSKTLKTESSLFSIYILHFRGKTNLLPFLFTAWKLRIGIYGRRRASAINWSWVALNLLADFTFLFSILR